MLEPIRSGLTGQREKEVFAKIAVCVTVLGFLLPHQAQAQSFNCRGNLTADEQTICGDRELAQLDIQLNNTYQRAVRNAPPHGQQQLRDAQRDWLNQRNACGRDRRCLRDIYRDQIAWLRQFD
jgi:uncharacterized protein